ncbi:MAG: hypothetical protein COA70_02540 [Planctomycetota bacterium]|nr:MAG: hypothetical protein COA70_02540 [Planctomycetota bacterium]
MLFSLIGTGCGFGLLAGGCAVLLGRVSGYRWDLPAILVGIGFGLIWAAQKYQKRKVSLEQVAVWMDLKNGGTGRLLHHLEVNDQTPLAGVQEPRPRPDLRRISKSLLPGFMFFAATLFLPVRTPAAVLADPFSAQRVEEVRAMAETLEETLTLREEQHEEIKENLAALEETAKGDKPEGDAMREALDSFESRLEDMAQEAADRLEQNIQRSRSAASQALSMDPAMQQMAMQELADLAAQMTANQTLSKQALSQDLMEELSSLGLSQEALDALQKIMESGAFDQLSQAASDFGLTPEQAAQFAQAMATQLSEEALKKLAELAQQGLLGSSENPGSGRMATAEELEAFLKSLEDLEPGGT